MRIMRNDVWIDLDDPEEVERDARATTARKEAKSHHRKKKKRRSIESEIDRKMEELFKQIDGEVFTLDDWESHVREEEARLKRAKRLGLIDASVPGSRIEAKSNVRFAE